MKKTMGKICAGLIAVVVLAVIFMRGDQLERLAETIQHGSPFLLILAVVGELARYLAQAASFKWCFRAVNERMPFKENVKLVFQTYFIDTVIPSGNMSDTSVVIAEASKRGIPTGAATGAALLRQVSVSIGFLLVMVLAFAGLAAAGHLQTGWLIMGLAAFVFVGILTGAMALAAAKPDWLLKIAAPLEKLIDKVAARLHRNTVDAFVKNMVDTYAESAKLIVKNKGDIARELAFSAGGCIFEMGSFALVCAAFGVHDVQAMVCGYVVATLFAMFSPVPQGVGVVEGVSLVAFTLFGIEQATGMAIIMVYRAIVFWLPFLVGAILMQRTTTKAGKDEAGTIGKSDKTSTPNITTQAS